MPDPRTYIKLHDGMPDHPKVEGLSDAAFRLLITTWCWSSRQLTDGRVPSTSWSKRGTARARKELIAAGLAEEVADGVEMHDYLEHQRSADQVAELRRKRQDAGSRGGKSKASAVAIAKQMPQQNGSKVVPETETETEELETSSSSGTAPRRAHRLPADWRPAETDITWQRSEGITDFQAKRETDKFRDYWAAKSGKDGTKLDWSATWRNWLRRAKEDGRFGPPTADPSRPAKPAWEA